MIAAWRDSPTRLREDATTEADLVRAGYRDRLLTELAQNAADAATKANAPGRLSVWLDGRFLHIANTGAPLALSGVHALTALRASEKPGAAASVGRFGVGFTAVLSASEEIEVRSTTGSLLFSRSATRDALRTNGVRLPEGTAEEALAPPVLRLAWPSSVPPVAGADTEVVLRLDDQVDGAALLATMGAEAADLLLALPALRLLRLGADEFVSETVDLGGGLAEVRIDGPGGSQSWWQYRAPRSRWLLPLRAGIPVPVAEDVLRAPTRSDEELSLPALLVADVAMQPDRRRLLPGTPVAELADGYADFARALPPKHRLVLVPRPGFARSETDGLLREALIAELRTHAWLPVIVSSSSETTGPEGFGPDALASTPNIPRALDDLVESGTAEALTDRRTTTEGATSKHRESDSGGAGQPGAGVASATPADRAGSAHRATSFGDGANPDFEAPSATDPAAATVSTGTADWADLAGDAPTSRGAAFESAKAESPTADADSVSWDIRPGAERGAATANTAVPTRASVFTDLTPDLADLLGDVIGPLVIAELSERRYAEALGVLDVHRLGLARLAELSAGLERAPSWWRRLYAALEPFVVDPLSAEELGALAVPLADGRLVTGPRTVVLDDELAAAIPVHWARLVHPEAAHPLLSRLGARGATVVDLLSDPGLRAELADGADPDTTDVVLRLAASADAEALPEWLGALELTDATGQSRPADELLLPDAPLRELLVEDSPFGVVAESVVDRYGAQALRAVGVGWDFSVVVEDDPTGPDHDLDDEDRWWAGLSDEPRRLAAVRDLDLVDADAWPEALWQLASDPRRRPLLTDRDGYTAWWLRTHAHIGGVPLGLSRHPSDSEFVGLLPEFAVRGLVDDPAATRAVLADPASISLELAAALLDALADPTRTPTPETISRTHALLAAAVADGRLDLADLHLPERVRVLSGAAVDPDAVFVLDQPWFGLAIPAGQLVLGDATTASSLAGLLDLPLVSEAVTAEVLGTGRRTDFATEPLAVVLRELFVAAVDDETLVVHEDLRVRVSGAVTATVSVPWWRADGAFHVRAPAVLD
ncbi:sacsin N-terminal ATP-binding-like domain-containing protein [Nocardia callitridis]|uniref:ATP-binding protein n=1 Tax=Nocardia callitridis TaxID=648753 RepID=A0ABP9KXT7_9NOCA